MRFPNELVRAFADHDGVLFVGAGLSKAAGLPQWSELISELEGDLSGSPEVTSFLDIAQYYEVEFGRMRLVSTLRQHLDTVDTKPTKAHQVLVKLPTHTILTTNFDNLLERALKEEGVPYTPVIGRFDAAFWTTKRTQLVKLHGDLNHPDSIVLTAQDYERFSLDRPTFVNLLANALQTRTVLFLGYSATDHNFRQVLTKVRDEVEHFARNLFTIQFNLTETERKYLRDWRGLNVINLPGADPLTEITDWLSEFTSRVQTEGKSTAKHRQTDDILQGRVNRTAAIVERLREVTGTDLIDDQHKIIRMRQGYTSFSIGENDHPADQDYQDVLNQEREVFLDLFNRGFHFKGLLSKRPIFDQNLYAISTRALNRWRIWQGRCSSLISFIQEALGQNRHDQLLLVCTNRTHLNEFSVGDRVLFQGLKSADEASYTTTRVLTDQGQVCNFNRKLEEEIAEQLIRYRDEIGASNTDSDPTRRFLEHTLRTLTQQKTVLDNRVELLERALSTSRPEDHQGRGESPLITPDPTSIELILWDIGEVLQCSFERLFLSEVAHKYERSFAELWEGRLWRDLMRGQIKENEYLEQIAREAGTETQTIKRIYDHFFEIPISQSLVVMSFLQDQRQAILSNHYSRIWDWLERFSVFRFMERDDVFLSYDVGLAKPDHAIYELVANRTGVPASRILFIDNQERNLVPARALGMSVVQFTTPLKLHEDLTTAGVLTRKPVDAAIY
ncbi:MAG: HAD-IA family hydrolase [bacterium]|nr:HAD-IA family hydrolase [bacterium]